jgi:hypothetical protein
MVVPRSHRGPVWDHHVNGRFGGAVDPGAIGTEIARAVPLTARAGSMSFHHVRLLHGSAQNVSARPRALLLFEYAAADAWPLVGSLDINDFEARLVAGSAHAGAARRRRSRAPAPAVLTRLAPGSPALGSTSAHGVRGSARRISTVRAASGATSSHCDGSGDGSWHAGRDGT